MTAVIHERASGGRRRWPLVLLATGLSALIYLGGGMLMGFAHDFRNRPRGVARVDGELVLVQRVCPGERVAYADISLPNTRDLDADRRVLRARAAVGQPGAGPGAAVVVPLRSDPDWQVTGKVIEGGSEYWVGEISDASGVSFSTTVLPFVPDDIGEGRITTSGGDSERLDDWLRAAIDC